ncbi:MAG TPA: hypothetical protein VKF38_12095 [Anaerolineaceae bacterium]|nr:hypothetical protein [Anaerolineaceae bacterium]
MAAMPEDSTWPASTWFGLGPHQIQPFQRGDIGGDLLQVWIVQAGVDIAYSFSEKDFENLDQAQICSPFTVIII